jgi:hypothetical protein
VSSRSAEINVIELNNMTLLEATMSPELN